MGHRPVGAAVWLCPEMPSATGPHPRRMQTDHANSSLGGYAPLDPTLQFPEDDGLDHADAAVAVI